MLKCYWLCIYVEWVESYGSSSTQCLLTRLLV